MAGTVDFWFDLGCPFTWRTSRWLTEVAAARDLDVTWRPMSLAILNQGKEIPAEYQDLMAESLRAGTVAQAVLDEHGQDALARFYTEVGTRLHEQGATIGPELTLAALAAAGLPESLARAGDDEGHRQALTASHEAGQARVGQESGSPITAIGEAPGFFGPVVVPAPTGDDAVRLYDGLALVSSVPAFSEVKRSRASF